MKLSTFIWLFFLAGIAFFIFDAEDKSRSVKPSWQDYAICAGQMKYEDQQSSPMLIKAYQFDVSIEDVNSLMVSIYEELRDKRDSSLSQKYFDHCERILSYERNQ